MLVAFIAAGCIGSDRASDASATPTATTPSAEPTIAATPTSEPTATPTAAPTEAPTPSPTPAEASVEPSPTGTAGSVDACTGNDSNRTFYDTGAPAIAPATPSSSTSSANFEIAT